MAQTQKTEVLKGTIVSADHSWKNPRNGMQTNKVRLDDGRLLVMNQALFFGPDAPLPGGKTSDKKPEEGVLSKLYNMAGNGVGQRVEVKIVSPGYLGKGHDVFVVQDLGRDPAFSPKLFRDRGFVDSLPVVGWMRNAVIRCG